jgi:hypothetical protein
LLTQRICGSCLSFTLLHVSNGQCIELAAEVSFECRDKYFVILCSAGLASHVDADRHVRNQSMLESCYADLRVPLRELW